MATVDSRLTPTMTRAVVRWLAGLAGAACDAAKAADAPQIDGAVYLSSRRPLKVGEIVTAKIERADQYDLHGSVAGF